MSVFVHTVYEGVSSQQAGNGLSVSKLEGIPGFASLGSVLHPYPIYPRQLPRSSWDWLRCFDPSSLCHSRMNAVCTGRHSSAPVCILRSPDSPRS